VPLLAYMRDWLTTAFGAMAAIGGLLFNSPSLPPWAWTVGQVLTTVGLAGLGLYAPSKKINLKPQDPVAPIPTKTP
jgi:hypothetical protein